MKKLLSFTLSLLVFMVAVVGVLVTKSETVKAQTPGNTHSTVIFNNWFIGGNYQGYNSLSILNASINMDLALQTPTSVDPALNLGPSGFNCSNGGTFNVPISATGEVAGWMTGWYDSPPVEFLNDIVAGGKKWIGHTNGLVTCTIQTYNRTNTSQCTPPEIYGDWNDAWTSTTANVSCRTISASMGECTIPAAGQGQITVTLQRGVRNFGWGYYAGDYQPLVHEGYYEEDGSWTAAFTPADLIAYNLAQADWQTSIPPDQIMQSTATINCLASAPALEVINVSHSPFSPSQDTQVSFNGTIKNTGNQTSNAFTPVLYIDEGSPSSVTIYAATPSAPLAPGAQSDVTWTNAWKAIAGTHLYRICPDLTSTGASCMVGNMIVPIPPAPPPVVNPPTADLWIVQTDVTDHSKNSTTIARGGSTKLGWSATNATSCTGSWTTGNLTPPVPPATNEVPQNNLTASKTYSLYCSRDGINSPTDTVTVNINNFAIGNFREL